MLPAELTQGMRLRSRQRLQAAVTLADREGMATELGQLYVEAREALIKLKCIDKMRHDVTQMNKVGETSCS